MNVTKRDGRYAVFDKEKIKQSVLKAFNEVDGEVTQYAKTKAAEIAGYVEGILSEHDNLNVEDIQDIVEDKLMASNRKDVARTYIIYRSTRSRVRERNSAWMKAIKEKLAATNVQNQNANVDEHSFGGRKGEADAELTKKLALDDYMSEMSRNNHLNNEIYIHDLDSYVVGMHNCLTIPFDKLLAEGFNTRQTDVRPAQSVNTAFQLVAVLFQLQSLQQFGGVSASHIDHTMVPYVRKSFYKHYITEYLKRTKDFLNLDLMDLLFDTYEDEIGIVRNRFDDWVEDHKDEFTNKTGLKFEDFTLNNKDGLDSELFQAALFDTINETYQAVEGMYHNLNTLQSRSGNQLNTMWLAA